MRTLLLMTWLKLHGDAMASFVVEDKVRNNEIIFTAFWAKIFQKRL